jgi:hypothetical protein
MLWNWKQLKADIALDTKNLRALKEQRRQKGSAWSYKDGRDLVDAKRRATVHHSCAAHIRNHLHLTQKWSDKDQCWYPLTKDDQAKLIAKVLPQYLPIEGIQNILEPTSVPEWIGEARAS